MNPRTALLIVLFAVAPLASAGPSVEIVSQAGPQSTAGRQWLQRLDEAGAGSVRMLSSGRGEPRIEELGETRSGAPIVKVYAVLTRSGELVLPDAGGGAKGYRLSDRAKLKDYFRRLESEGAAGVTTPRGRFGLTQAEATDLFTRLQRPIGAISSETTLAELVEQASKNARLEIKVDPSIAEVLQRKANSQGLGRLTVGTALAAALRDEGLALQPERPIGSMTMLKVVSSAEAKDAWPVGHDPEGPPSRIAPMLMEFLTVEVEGYSLAEAFEAITPRLTWKDAPLPVVWDRFALRAAGIDPTAVQVRFPSRRTYYKKLLNQLAIQARLKVDLRVDEAGTPLLYVTR